MEFSDYPLAVNLLHELLDEGTPVWLDDIWRMGANRGISRKALKEARRDLGIISCGTPEGQLWFSVPPKKYIEA